MTSEAVMRATLVNALRKAGCFAQSVESGSTGFGVPDVFVRTTGRDVWIELKVLRMMSRLKNKIPFRNGQESWLKSYANHGGLALLIVATRDGICVFKNDNIRDVYEGDILQACDFIMPKLDIEKLLKWINEQ